MTQKTLFSHIFFLSLYVMLSKIYYYLAIFKFSFFLLFSMTIVNISNHGRITIPSVIRKKYGWKDGDKIIIIDHPLEGIKILPYISDEKLKEILDKETGLKIIEEISKERKLEIQNEKERLYKVVSE